MLYKPHKSVFALMVLLPMTSDVACANESYGSYEDNPFKFFNASEVFHEQMKITWVRTDKNGVLKECNAVREKFNLAKTGNPLNGCTIWDKDSCIVITEKSTTIHTLGHEIRHCYQHGWH